jgi:signal transduction histidine kinase
VNIGALTVSRAHIRANRYDLLCRLVDGLAHEVKNPVHAAIINLELLRRRSERPDPGWIVERVGILEYEIGRVHELVDGLFRFIRSDLELVEWVDTDGVIGSILPILRAYAQVARVEVSYQPAGDLLIPMNGAAIQQVVLNLAVNAVEALRPTGGRVEIRGTMDEREVQLRIRVSAAGESASGIEPWSSAVTPECSDPGFAISRALAEEAGGRIEVERAGDDATGASLLIALRRAEDA